MPKALLELASLSRTAAGHLLLAKQLFDCGRYVESLEQLAALLNDDPQLAFGHFVKGLVLARLADYHGAATALERALQLDERLTVAWNALAQVHAELGEIPRALWAVGQSLAVDDAQPAMHLLAGSLSDWLQEPRQSADSYRAAFRYNPQLAVAHLKLARQLQREARTHEAVEHVIAAARLNPLTSAGRVALGDLLRSLGDTAAAAEEYRAATQLARPNDALPLARLAETLFHAGEVDQAVATFQAAVARDPKQLFCLLRLGRICMDQARYADAAELFRAAVAVDPHFPESQTLLDAALAAQAMEAHNRAGPRDDQ